MNGRVSGVAERDMYTVYLLKTNDIDWLESAVSTTENKMCTSNYCDLTSNLNDGLPSQTLKTYFKSHPYPYFETTGIWPKTSREFGTSIQSIGKGISIITREDIGR